MTILDHCIHHSDTVLRISLYCPETMLDRTTTLCLACSSSLPPNVEESELFTTKCCRRPICPKCLETNPRLARYNPCLTCLAGVGVIQASSSSRQRSEGRPVGGARGQPPTRVENLDGGIKERDLFVLAEDGDEDSDEDDGMGVDGEDDREFPRSAAPPPPDVIQTVSPLPKTPPPPFITTEITEPPTPNRDERPPKPDIPVVYRLRRGDTLMGIALRFRLDVGFFVFFHLILPFILTDRTAIRGWSCAG